MTESRSADPCASHQAVGIHLDPCCPNCSSPPAPDHASALSLSDPLPVIDERYNTELTATISRVRALITDLQAECEVMTGTFDPEKWSIDVPVPDLLLLLTPAERADYENRSIYSGIVGYLERRGEAVTRDIASNFELSFKTALFMLNALAANGLVHCVMLGWRPGPVPRTRPKSRTTTATDTISPRTQKDPT